MIHGPPRSARALALLLFLSLLGLGACATSGGPRPGAAGVGDPYYPNSGNGGFDVEHYDLELDVDMESATLAGRARILATTTQALSTFNLDFSGFVVREVWVNERPVAHRRDGSELIVQPAEPLDAGTAMRVIVVYDGVPALIEDPAVSFAPGVGWGQRDDSVYVISQPTGAHGFFPCSDHPSDKATVSMHVSVPEGYTVAANGTPDEPGWRDGKLVWSWHSRDPMATYLVTVAIDRLDLVEQSGPGGLPLRHYFPEGSDPELRVPFEATSAMLEFFAERIGPYPFESYGGILSSREDFGGALETQTLPVYGLGAGHESVIAHELAHQWFGNDVSLERWSDIWLNEGIAEYLSLLWLRERDGEEAFVERLAKLQLFVQTRQVGPPLDPGVENLFGVEVYLRGSLAVHALHRALGDELFFAVLSEFYSSHAGGSANIDDFTTLVAERGGREARDELVRWLTREAPPRIPELDDALKPKPDA